ncbi:MAG TPA: type II secretion system protein GspD [Gammaproteobacteria bacterium]|nr:type II secretion system protein GspD [Gammaproteobacteria bacterium]
MKDVDIRKVIETVSRATGKNFIISPDVKGMKVTVISHTPMNADQVYQVFLSILKVHGLAAIPSGDIIKIVPEVAAKQEGVEVATPRHPGVGDDFVTRVIEVRHVDAGQLVPILRPLVPQRGHLAAYPASNVLVISDRAANISRLAEIIRRIDQSTGGELEVIPLEHAAASEIVRILEQLQRKDPKGAASGPRIVADDRTNSILLAGDQASRLRLRAIIAHLDTAVDVGGQTHVIYLKNANAKDLVPVLTGVSESITAPKTPGAAAPAPANRPNINIQADEATNALVINAPPEVFRSLRAVIRQLDVRRAQVLVEAVIADMSVDTTRELGVQWVVDGRGGGNAVGVVNFTLGTPISALANLENPPALNGFNFGIGDLTGTNQFAALLSALSGDASTNILSTPSVLTLDNEEAELVVGQNVPFITGSFSGTGSGGSNPSNPFQTIQREDVGLTLRIKPQINEGNAITLDVEQEVSSISPSTQGADLITNKRSIKTTVLVEDGQMVVLGGLIREELQESEQRVPGLGDIPVLGWLFRYQRTQKVKSNLMVFLHPTILKDPALQAGYTSLKYNYIRAEQMAIREEGVPLMADEASPLLPELKDYLTLPPAYDDVAGTNAVPEEPIRALQLPPEAPGD